MGLRDGTSSRNLPSHSNKTNRFLPVSPRGVPRHPSPLVFPGVSGKIPHMARTSWHPAFVQAIENELEESRNALTFEAEHQLTSEPLKIDVLIIKKKKNVVIKKNIGQIFRLYNVVE